MMTVDGPGLTDSLLEALQEIEAPLSLSLPAPTSKRLGKILGVSKQAADLRVQELIRRGYLTPRGGKWQSIALTEKGIAVFHVEP